MNQPPEQPSSMSAVRQIEDPSVTIPAEVKPPRRANRGRDFLMSDTVRDCLIDGRATLVIPVRLTSYRSLPLSCIEGISLSLDGAPVAESKLRLRLNGTAYRLQDLGALASVWWWILDPAELLVALDADLAVGTHALSAELVTVEPYVTNGRFHFHYASSRTFEFDQAHQYQETGAWL